LNINSGAAVQLNQRDALGWNTATLANAVTQININGGMMNNAVNANNSYQASWTLTGGTMTSTGGGSFHIRAGNSITTNASATGSLISAPLTLRSGTGTQVAVNVADEAAANDLWISGAISTPDAIGINKTGTGTLTLSGANIYNGATTVGAGRLIVSGASASSITVTGGTLVPSGTPSTTGGLNIQSGGRFEITTAGPSQLTVGGSITLAGALDILPGPGLAPSTSFVILNNTSTGPVSGAFAGKPQGSTFAAGGYVWAISYAGGNGNNDVVVTTGTLQQNWRLTNFGADWNNDAMAGDAADPDGDNVSNLLERAFGGNPNVLEQNLLPAIDNTAPLLSITYRKAKAATDLVFTVQESPDLSPTSWTAAVGASTVLNPNDSANPVQIIRFTASPGTTGKKFLRVQVAN
jgi:autotransporter-associated beta strand protein